MDLKQKGKIRELRGLTLSDFTIWLGFAIHFEHCLLYYVLTYPLDLSHCLQFHLFIDLISL